MGRGRGTSARTSTSRTDPYAVLKVARDADAATIKKAFRTVARANHPDMCPNDAAAEERFKAANNAYEILSDAGRRADYDRGPIASNGPRPRAQQSSTGFGSTPSMSAADAAAARARIDQEMRDMIADLTGVTQDDPRRTQTTSETEDSFGSIASDFIDGLGDRFGRVRQSPGATDALEDARSVMERIREDARRRAERFGI